MQRALALVMLFLALGSATGMFAALAEPDDECADACGDDGPRGSCPPVCGCSCIARTVTVVPTAQFVVPLADSLDGELLQLVTVDPRSPEPQEILHIPKRAS